MSADQDNSSPAQHASVSLAELQQAVLPLQPQAGQQPPPQAPSQEIQSGASGNVAGSEPTNAVDLHRRKMFTHALQKMTRDLFRAMSLGPRQKCPRNVVEMKEAMAAFFGTDSVAISCQCKRSKIILVEGLTEVCSLENIASWNWRKSQWHGLIQCC